MTPRTWPGALAALVIGAVLASPFLVASSCATLTPADQANVARDGVELSVCGAGEHICKLADGGAAKCWAEFDACMVAHGFYDGGSDAR